MVHIPILPGSLLMLVITLAIVSQWSPAWPGILAQPARLKQILITAWMIWAVYLLYIWHARYGGVL